MTTQATLTEQAFSKVFKDHAASVKAWVSRKRNSAAAKTGMRDTTRSYTPRKLKNQINRLHAAGFKIHTSNWTKNTEKHTPGLGKTIMGKHADGRSFTMTSHGKHSAGMYKINEKLGKVKKDDSDVKDDYFIFGHGEDEGIDVTESDAGELQAAAEALSAPMSGKSTFTVAKSATTAGGFALDKPSAPKMSVDQKMDTNTMVRNQALGQVVPQNQRYQPKLAAGIITEKAPTKAKKVLYNNPVLTALGF